MNSQGCNTCNSVLTATLQQVIDACEAKGRSQLKCAQACTVQLYIVIGEVAVNLHV